MALSDEERRERKKLYAARRRAKVKADPELLARKREQDRLLKRKIRADNPGVNAEYQREWYRKNPDKIRQYSAKQYERIRSDPMLIERVNARHRVENMTREQVLEERERKRALAQKRREQRRADGLSPSDRYRSIERHRLDYRCYRMLRDMLFMGYMGRVKTYRSFPFSSVELVAHLDPLVKAAGFEWSGYGTVWNVDHRRPLADFDYTSDQDEAFKECWALSNLRPMCVLRNRSKGRRLDGDWIFID